MSPVAHCVVCGDRCEAGKWWCSDECAREDERNTAYEPDQDPNQGASTRWDSA